MLDLDDASVEKNLDASIKDGTAYSVMQGLGETAVPLCAIFLAASEWWLALLMTLPLFVGSCAQLVAVPMIDRLGRRWPLVLGGSLVQALTWIPMIVALFLPPRAGLIVVTVTNIVYFAAWHFCIPPWNSTMGDIVPAEARGRYFGMRNSVASVLLLLSGIAGGLVLTIFKDAGRERWGFVVIFAGSTLARLLSLYWLSRMKEPAHAPSTDRGPSLIDFVRGLRTNNFSRFVLCVACANASAHVAGSLTPLYFKQICGYEYWGYAAAVQVLVLAQILCLPAWGRLADRRGNRHVMVLTLALITPAPLLWLLSKHLAWSCAVQVLAGVGWAGFNLALNNFLFDAVEPAHRARSTAYLNFFVNTGVLAGGAIAMLLAWLKPVDLGPLSLSHWIYAAFIVSFVLRVGTFLLILPRFREVRR